MGCRNSKQIFQGQVPHREKIYRELNRDVRDLETRFHPTVILCTPTTSHALEYLYQMERLNHRRRKIDECSHSKMEPLEYIELRKKNYQFGLQIAYTKLLCTRAHYTLKYAQALQSLIDPGHRYFETAKKQLNQYLNIRLHWAEDEYNKFCTLYQKKTKINVHNNQT